MKSVMESRWYGNISPHDTIVEDNRYYKKLLKFMGQNRDRLSETLTPEIAHVLGKGNDEARYRAVAEKARDSYQKSV